MSSVIEFPSMIPFRSHHEVPHSRQQIKIINAYIEARNLGLPRIWPGVRKHCCAADVNLVLNLVFFGSCTPRSDDHVNLGDNTQLEYNQGQAEKRDRRSLTACAGNMCEHV